MATSKKTAPKRKAASQKASSASISTGTDSLLVLAMTWAFTLLSVVFAVVAYWRYA